MKGIWAVSVVFGIALMLGIPPIQSNAESPECDEIEELVAAGKIPAEAGAIILEMLDCDATVVIVFFHDENNVPIPKAVCGVGYFIPDATVNQFEATNEDGLAILIIPVTSPVFQNATCFDEFGGKHTKCINPPDLFFDISIEDDSECGGGGF